MRGKADVVLNRIDRIGITPAYAGKRVIRSSFHKLFQDHPRLCGEKQHFFYFLVYTGGSPPPMRGKAARFLQFLPPAGITPAYAGKSLKLPSCFFVDQDHPRLCGEKRCPLWCPLRFRGSPPPMRGKEMPLGQGVLHFRITPAYAGKRPIPCTPTAVCKGSPPPMRGKGCFGTHFLR